MISALIYSGCSFGASAPETAAVFVDDTEVLNLDFAHQAVADDCYLMPENIGSGVALFDYDLDGFLDLYIANYVDYDSSFYCPDKAGRPEYCGPKAFPGVRDQLWRNKGDGTFEDRAFALGLALNELGREKASMGIAIGDLGHDQRFDLYLTHLRGESNTLYQFVDDIGYLDRSSSASLERPAQVALMILR